MKILNTVYQDIMNSYPFVPPEQGGIIGGKKGIVTNYHHDSGCQIFDRGSYIPDIEALNAKIAEWSDLQIEFLGLLHSHLPDQETPSGSDNLYIKNILGALPLNHSGLYFPIVIPKQKIISYFAKKENDSFNLYKDQFVILEN